MIPYATTTITIRRPSDDARPYEPDPEPVTVATGVRAHIGSPTGRERLAGGEMAITDLRMTCDPVDLRHIDTVEDETTGETFTVVWSKQRTGLGMDHTAAYLKHTEGVS